MSISRFLTHAEQTRQLCIKLGETIEGTETHGEYWHTSRLTLLWRGESVAVWSVIEKSSKDDNWSNARESASFSLAFREWRKVKQK